MDLSKVKKVVEVTSVVGPQRVNEYLDAGWVIIETSSMSTESGEYSEAHIKYALGWCQDGEPKEPARQY